MWSMDCPHFALPVFLSFPVRNSKGNPMEIFSKFPTWKSWHLVFQLEIYWVPNPWTPRKFILVPIVCTEFPQVGNPRPSPNCLHWIFSDGDPSSYLLLLFLHFLAGGINRRFPSIGKAFPGIGNSTNLAVLVYSENMWICCTHIEYWKWVENAK